MSGQTFITLVHIKISYKSLACLNYCGFYQLLMLNKKPTESHGLKTNENSKLEKSNFFTMIFIHFSQN